MSTPEEFAVDYLDALDRDEQPQLAKRIEARDAAVEFAAKREALDDFVSLTFQLFAHPHMIGPQLAREVRRRLLAKYEADASEERTA